MSTRRGSKSLTRQSRDIVGMMSGTSTSPRTTPTPAGSGGRRVPLTTNNAGSFICFDFCICLARQRRVSASALNSIKRVYWPASNNHTKICHFGTFWCPEGDHFGTGATLLATILKDVLICDKNLHFSLCKDLLKRATGTP